MSFTIFYNYVISRSYYTFLLFFLFNLVLEIYFGLFQNNLQAAGYVGRTKQTAAYLLPFFAGLPLIKNNVAGCFRVFTLMSPRFTGASFADVSAMWTISCFMEAGPGCRLLFSMLKISGYVYNSKLFSNLFSG